MIIRFKGRMSNRENTNTKQHFISDTFYTTYISFPSAYLFAILNFPQGNGQFFCFVLEMA